MSLSALHFDLPEIHRIEMEVMMSFNYAREKRMFDREWDCLLYTSDAADD